jgi:23S rRNA pseudouridine1911/1915/1917 synthase
MPIIEVPFEVEQNYDGWRLDRYLQQKITRLSRARIQVLIRERLRCETRSLKPASPVRPGLKFVLLKDVDDEAEPLASGPIGILHDDPHLLVLDKPSGLAVHPSARYFRHTVTQWMLEHALGPDGVRPDLGHRLDRETSGVLACGRGIAATRALKFSFARRETEKTYLALTEGRIARDALSIDTPMRLTETVKVIMEIHPEGLPSLTDVRVLRRGTFRSDGKGVTLVECRPKTGRQHQIRVHLKSVGHPIVGDKIYGGEVEQFLRFCRGEQTEADRDLLRMPRHALHAAKLTLPHPITRVITSFEAPLAPDLQRFCDEAIAWDSAQQAA